MAEPRVVVVGAGIGGLVSALLLASRGVNVQVIEAASTPGGKIRRQVSGGQAIDAGPTVLTLRWVFEQIFESAGASFDTHVRLQPLSVLARHAWGGDPLRDRLDLHADRAHSSDAIGRFAGAAEARRFDAFCAEARRLYQALEGPYIRSQRPGVGGMVARLGPRGLARLTALGPLTSMASLLSRRFQDPRLRQLFGRYATYCGASPWAAPATLMLVAQVEMDGVWSVDGGLHALALAVEGLARQRGAVFTYGTSASEIVVDRSGGRVQGVRTSDGAFWPADAVVFNGDADALAQGLLGESVRPAVPARRPADRSLSALTCAVSARAHGFPLERHNVFFQPDYLAEFDDVFHRGRLPRAGTVYLCAQDRGAVSSSGCDATAKAAAVTTAACGDPVRFDPPTDPCGPERLLMLVNAPPNGDVTPPDPEETRRCVQTSLDLLTRCGLTIERTAETPWVRTLPQDFARLYPGSGGGLYGSATNGWMALFRRPGSTTRLPGLFLAGGSVHPGPGVPMAAMSGLLAAETVMAHLASTRRWHPAATSGGTSTPSATTAGTG